MTAQKAVREQQRSIRVRRTDRTRNVMDKHACTSMLTQTCIRFHKHMWLHTLTPTQTHMRTCTHTRNHTLSFVVVIALPPAPFSFFLVFVSFPAHLLAIVDNLLLLLLLLLVVLGDCSGPLRIAGHPTSASSSVRGCLFLDAFALLFCLIVRLLPPLLSQLRKPR